MTRRADQKFVILALYAFFMCIALFASNNAYSAQISVEQAYNAIPHRQTTYSHSKSNIRSKIEARYLSEFFTMTDEAVKLRVVTMYYLSNKRPFDMGQYNKMYDVILDAMNHMQFKSVEANKARYLIIEAIQEQQLFLNEWAKDLDNSKYKNYSKNPRVLKSHKKLLTAYNYLLHGYNSESKHNKQAFYDHLCALDFI